jgi:hypothetical protein
MSSVRKAMEALLERLSKENDPIVEVKMVSGTIERVNIREMCLQIIEEEKALERRTSVCGLSGRIMDLDTGKIVGHVDDENLVKEDVAAVTDLPTPEPKGVETVAKRQRGKPKRK